MQRKQKNYTDLVRPVPYVAIHHTTGTRCQTLETCIGKMQYFQRLHMNVNKMNDIAYNFVVGSSNYVFIGREWKNSGSHCFTYNTKSIGLSIESLLEIYLDFLGIGVIGDYSSMSPSKSMLNTVKLLIDCGITRNEIQKNYTLLGHWGVGVTESFADYLNRSRDSVVYCRKKN